MAGPMYRTALRVPHDRSLAAAGDDRRGEPRVRDDREVRFGTRSATLRRRRAQSSDPFAAIQRFVDAGLTSTLFTPIGADSTSRLSSITRAPWSVISVTVESSRASTLP
jgi:hypothetical protein